ncbi:TerD family protein [Dermacoccus nishinomiyaensis]|uniref:TerD family protein n=1 Tax=Dermacoccus nishinomiyaensis TaxID=1274 RepID=UPI000E04A0D4|nr:TerD family protein [Dermacoccus nishinomiyaensis]QQY24554.1 TerD family protein [Dermacoccus nishinomiyaensis]STD19752.1 General stress protein 16U [Dermacoccus nishinomiyaensis]HCQ18025.1 tellurium resistance protein [Dermacoccus sp.]
MNELSKGANAPLGGTGLAITVVGTQPGTVDLMVLQLTADGVVRTDDDFVFYNQPRSPEGAVRLDGGDITVDLSALPPQIERLAVAVAMDDAAPGSLASSPQLAVTIDAHGEQYAVTATGFTSERAAVLVEIYLRGGAWKVRNVSAGWDGGLPALLREHGVSVENDTPQTPLAAASTAGPLPATPPVAAPPVAAPPAAAPMPSSSGPVDLGKRTGAISLTKGQRVSIEKSPVITARIEWPAATDYDVFALVRYADGHDETVATFGTKEQPHATQRSSDGAVTHLGDVGRARTARTGGGLFGRKKQSPPAPMASETIEIRLNPKVVAVLPVVYSAQSNGTGSFRRYQVSMSIDNGAGTSVRIDASNASDHDNIYTCVPGIVVNSPDGVIVDSLELYSAPTSELRPVLDDHLTVHMDAGGLNLYK